MLPLELSFYCRQVAHEPSCCPCCLGWMCLQLMRVFILHGRLVCASQCACAWGSAPDDIEVWASGEATAQKSLMMTATDDYLKPSMCNQQHTRVWIVFDALSPAPYPLSKLLILLRGSWWDTIYPSRHRGTLPVYHTDNIHIDKHIHTLIHTYRQFRVSSEWNLHVFWCVGGIRSPPCRHAYRHVNMEALRKHARLYIAQWIKAETSVGKPATPWISVALLMSSSWVYFCRRSFIDKFYTQL